MHFDSISDQLTLCLLHKYIFKKSFLKRGWGVGREDHHAATTQLKQRHHSLLGHDPQVEKQLSLSTPHFFCREPKQKTIHEIPVSRSLLCPYFVAFCHPHCNITLISLHTQCMENEKCNSLKIEYGSGSYTLKPNVGMGGYYRVLCG